MDIGIDLGTTFSVIAVNGKVDLAADYPPAIFLEDCGVTIIPTPYGEETFPSVMVEDPDNPGRYLFGTDAVQKAEAGIAPVMFSKRKIGSQEPIPQPTRPVTAKDFAREFLRYMKACAERALGRPIARAVVTHPAYFDRGAVEETRAAAIEAGFDMSRPEQMLMEPVAAALAYTRTDARDPLRVLTYDLGGGTLDVTYLVRRQGVIEMRAFDGDHLLGGYNFDRELAHWIRRNLESPERQIVLNEDDPVDRGRLARLLRFAEQTKIALARAATDDTPVDVRGRDILVDQQRRPVQINLRITRHQFVELIAKHLEQARFCCERAMAKAGVHQDEVDEVLLVGGSTYAPWVGASLASLFSGRVPRLFRPDLCVGAGAAIHARMVLPLQVGGGGFTLMLEVPEHTVIDTVNIAGQLVPPDGQSVPGGLRAGLSSSRGDGIPPAALDGDGRFLFTGVELSVDGPQDFVVCVSGAGSAPLVQHRFTVTYTPETAEMSGVTTVLPKPLYIETLHGLVPLAEEGVALPAKRCQTFTRINDNPHVTLRLFQEHEPIGEVRIEDVPSEGGRGSLVELSVEVTEKNRVQGTARILTPAGKVVMQAPVAVLFTIPQVASAPDLRAKFEALVACFNAEVEPLRAQCTGVWADGRELIRRVRCLFEMQPLERQEVQRAVRQLELLLKPPADDMKPTLAEFMDVLQQCRSAAQTLKERVQGHPDGRARSVAKAEHALDVLDKLEAQAQESHRRRDRIVWSRLFDALTDVQVHLRDKPKQGPVPTAFLKLLAAREIGQQQDALARKQAQLAVAGRQADWQDEIDRLNQALNAALAELRRIPDDLPEEQGNSRIRLLMSRSVAPMRDVIERVGIDIAHRGAIRPT